MPGIHTAFTAMLTIIIYVTLAAYSSDVSARPVYDAVAGGRKCPLKIIAVIPNRGEYLTPVNIYGENFSQEMKLYVGDKIFPFNFIDRFSISIAIPKLPYETYPLFLKKGEKCRSNSTDLKVTEERPTISSIIPDQLYYCSPAIDRAVLIKGNNFSKKTKVLFDGVVVGSTFHNSKEIEVNIPQVESGYHNIQAVNPGGVVSIPNNFYIEGKPIIYNIRLGINYGNHYELLVEGENFLWGAAPEINGEMINSGIIYKGCNLLVYDRETEGADPKNVPVQVVNPNGQKSGLFYLSVP